jgi:hypothetical protein
MTYDPRGNLQSGGQRLFVYDALDRLVRVERGPRIVGTYRYDAAGAEAGGADEFRGKGRRIGKDVRFPVADQPAGPLRYLYAGDLVIEERDASGNLLRQYLYEDGGRPAALIRHTSSDSPQALAFLHDGAGSVTAVVNGLGGVEESVRYSPHGAPQIISSFNIRVSYSKFGNGLLFGGSYYDYELGLIRAGGRCFDPALGRYLTDESPLLPAAPLELNGYLAPGLPGFPGEVTGEGSARRSAEYLEPFRVELRGVAGCGHELADWEAMPDVNLGLTGERP